jgi:hypothetical protein
LLLFTLTCYPRLQFRSYLVESRSRSDLPASSSPRSLSCVKCSFPKIFYI